ncbi:MAG: hypothetical protein U0269_34615 [Polyangiales bacterium]
MTTRAPLDDGGRACPFAKARREHGAKRGDPHERRPIADSRDFDAALISDGRRQSLEQIRLIETV